MTDKEVKKAACDPGWNDPPLFSYEAHQAQQHNRKRTSLNKRVVFPSTPPPPGGQLGEQIQPHLPPKSPFTNVPPPPSTPPVSATAEKLNSESGGNSEEITLANVMDNFRQTIAEVYGDEKEKQSSDVLRRVQMMETMWQDEKFDLKVKDKIFKLSEALKGEDLDTADNLQKSLMVDHSSLCSPWMSGVRHMLNSKRALSVQN